MWEKTQKAAGSARLEVGMTEAKDRESTEKESRAPGLINQRQEKLVKEGRTGALLRRAVERAVFAQAKWERASQENQVVRSEQGG